MIKFYRKISIIIALALLVAGIPVQADAPLVKKVMVNVAKHKPVTVSAISYASYPGTAITDDNLKNASAWIAARNAPGAEEYEGKNWAVIDLLRKYKLNKIILFDRGDTATITTKGNFKILASNDESFAEYDVLAERGTYTEENDQEFPSNGNFVLEIEDNKSYRYVKYEKTNITPAQIREIQVFSEITVTEVAQGKATFGSPVLGQVKGQAYTGYMGTNNLVDGDIKTYWQGATQSSTTYDGTPLTNVYSTAVIDLGDKYPVGMVELYGVSGSDNAAAKGFFGIYGSNNPITENEMSDTDMASEKQYYHMTHQELTELENYEYNTLIYNNSEVGSYTLSDGSIYNTFPKVEEGCYQGTVDDNTPYRYIIYRRVTYPATASQLSEFRAYVINPQVSDINVDNNIVTVNFSDDMDPYSYSGNIKAFDEKSQESLEVEILSEDEATCVFKVADVYNTQVRIEIGEGVKNQKNVGFAEKAVYTFKAEKALRVDVFKITDRKDGTGNEAMGLTGKTELGAFASVTNVSQELQKVVLLLGFYDDGGNLIGLETASKAMLTGSTEELTVGADITPQVKEAVAYLINGYGELLSWTNSINIY